jgi:hypothetical protein
MVATYKRSAISQYWGVFIRGIQTYGRRYEVLADHFEDSVPSGSRLRVIAFNERS